MQRMASGCPEDLMCTIHSESILELAAEAKEEAQVREESESDSESDSDVDSVTLSTLNLMNNLVDANAYNFYFIPLSWSTTPEA